MAHAQVRGGTPYHSTPLWGPSIRCRTVSLEFSWKSVRGCAMKHGLYAFCISTIVEKKTLKQFEAKGSGQITENSPWVTGAVLLQDAQKIGAEMPVIFSDAAHDAESLLYWAVLRRIDIDGRQTVVGFDKFSRIRGRHGRSDLTRRSPRKRIKPNYIRPYAICETPPFVK